MAEESLNKRETWPVVLKADGLAAGKGVFVCKNRDEALGSLKELDELPSLRKASDTLVIEEFLDGREISIFAVSDGKTSHIISSARDYKRIGEGDTGLNTGGMGSITPVPDVDASMLEEIQHTIVDPTIKGMAGEGTPYRGLSVLRTDVDQRWTNSCGVQLPFWRSRNAGGPSKASDRSDAAHAPCGNGGTRQDPHHTG